MIVVGCGRIVLIFCGCYSHSICWQFVRVIGVVGDCVGCGMIILIGYYSIIYTSTTTKIILYHSPSTT